MINPRLLDTVRGFLIVSDRLGYNGTERLQDRRMALTYRQLQAKVKELIESGKIEPLDLGSKRAVLAAALAKYEANQVTVAPIPAELKETCSLCGSPVSIKNNWLHCTVCPHKQYVG